MSEIQTIYGGLLAFALVLAAMTPGRGRDDVILAAMAVAASWAMCIAAYMPVTPAGIILWATGAAIEPTRLWAAQDAVIGCALAAHFIERRSGVVFMVGLLFAAQSVWHIVYRLNTVEYPVYAQALDALFLAQLVTISWEGGRHAGNRIVHFCRKRMGRGDFLVSPEGAGDDRS